MKKEYISPDIDIVKVDCLQVIADSGSITLFDGDDDEDSDNAATYRSSLWK